MSQNPFGGIQPVELPFSGTTDANGSFTYESQIRAAFWCNVKMTALCPGNPIWLVEVGGNPGAPGIGPQTDLGPFLVGPGEKVKVTITNAQPKVAVRGNFVGIQGDQASVIASYAPTPNTVSIQQTAVQQEIGSGTFTSTSLQQNSHPVPPGTHGMMWQFAFHAATSAFELRLTGGGKNNSPGYLYINRDGYSGTAGAGQLSIAQPETIWNSAKDLTAFVQCQLNAVSEQTLDYSLIALLDPSVIVAQQQANDIWTVTQSASPPLWRAPTQILQANSSVNGSFSILAGVAGQKIYLFGWELANDGATAAGAIALLSDTVRASPANRLAYALGTSAVGGNASGNYGGAPLPVGAGIQLEVFGAGGGSWRTSVAVSQG